MSTKNRIRSGQKDIFTITARTNIFRCYWHSYIELHVIAYITNIPLDKEYKFLCQSIQMSVHLINLHLSADLLQSWNKNFIATDILHLYSLIPTINNTERESVQTCKAQAVDDISDIMYDKVLLNYHIAFTAVLCVMQNNDIWTIWNLYSAKCLSFHSTAVSTCTTCFFSHMMCLWFPYILTVNGNYFPKQH